MKKTTLYLSGAKCNSCKLFIEEVLNKQPGVRKAKVSLSQRTVSFETDLDDPDDRLAEILTEKVKANGYSFSASEQTKTEKNDQPFWLALPIGLAILALFFVLQRSGILNFGIGETITPVTSFVIGLVASVSSCLAIVGGLVLSLSATVAKDKLDDTRPMLIFHAGRLVGFALLGGALGALGGAIGFSPVLGAALGVVASLVMIALGLNLIGVFKSSSIAISPKIFDLFRRIEHRTLAPALIGVGTFFLPCGFTQAIQFVSLSSGSFVSGSLIMTAFALGTLPMLALLSFGSISFSKSRHARLFFSSAGVVVIGLGLFALLTGLAGLGVINPFLIYN